MEKKTFAFKLADKTPKGPGKWQARDGVALAGCTEIIHMNYRELKPNGDTGVFC
jgi:hypothetical protein